MRIIDLTRVCDEYTHFMIYDVETHFRYECNKYGIQNVDLYKVIKSLIVENSTLICNVINKINIR